MSSVISTTRRWLIFSLFSGITGKTKIRWCYRARWMLLWWCGKRVQTLSKDFKIFNLTEPPVLPPNPVCKGWTKPPNGYVKVNVDAAVSFGCSGFGAVVRDHDSFVIGACYNNVKNSLDAIWAELKALSEGLKLATRLKVAKLILESDSA
ncbi:hypothetical protein Goarm_011117, partial [Gossypium armourianum]|nr:hypothetical protein [Gossypium armourianum]